MRKVLDATFLGIGGYCAYRLIELSVDLSIDHDLLNELDDVVSQGGGDVHREFESDEVSNDVSFELCHMSDFDVYMSTYHRTARLASIKHPLMKITKTTRCKKTGYVDGEWEKGWVKVPTYPSPHPGLFEDLKCDVTFHIEERF